MRIHQLIIRKNDGEGERAEWVPLGGILGEL